MPDAEIIQPGVTSTGKKWYVVHTYSGFEQKAKAALEERVRSLRQHDDTRATGEKFGDVVVPVERVQELGKGGQRKVSNRKFFPGYIFVIFMASVFGVSEKTLIITAGLLLAMRGCGTFVAMMLVGRLMRYIEARTLIISGLSITCLSLFYMTAWTDQTGVNEIVVISIVQGFGFGLVFVPLSTVAFLTLPNHLRTDGTSMLTLMRNVASSIGISLVIAQLTEGSRRTYAILSQHVNPFNHAMQMPDVRALIDMGTDKGRAMADAMVNIQAQIIAFSHDYQMVMLFTLCAIPLAIMIGSTKAALRKQSLAPEQAVIE